MKLSNENYEVLLDILKENGYKNDHVKTDNFKHYVENKHINRFLDLISFLKSNKIEPNHTALSTSYKLDVVLRRMLSEVLKPIELGVAAALANYFRFNNINGLGDIGTDMLDDMSEFDNSLAQKRIGTQNFVFNSIKSINSKYKCKGDIQRIICKMSLGQIMAFVEILNQDVLNSVFGREVDKTKLIILLDDIVFLRNMIAHHNMILTTHKIVNHKRTISLKILIESLSSIADGDYSDKLSKDILRYRDNSIRKYCVLEDGTVDDAKKTIYEAVFTSAHKKIFGI